MSKQIYNPVFDKVLLAGPALKGKGGIASVLASYSRCLAPFHFLATNSPSGTVAGAFRLLATMAAMPVERMRGRKILHLHYAGGKSWIRKRIVMAWGRALGFRIVAHCHAHNMDTFSRSYGTERVRKVLSKASANIVLSPSWRDFFNKEIDCGNVEVINNIVESPDASLLRAHDGKDPVKFIFLGELGHRKGIFDILDAVTAMSGNGSFKLLIGGNGEVGRVKKIIDERGLSDRVEYLGWVSGERKSQLLADSDVLLLPSYAEGLPISILEAMAYGMPVISTNVGGIPEVLTDGCNGFMVNPGDVAQIKAAMQAYVDSPQLIAEHGARSREKVAPYLAENVVAQLGALYERVLGGE